MLSRILVGKLLRQTLFEITFTSVYLKLLEIAKADENLPQPEVTAVSPLKSRTREFS